jgi:hypothetical protein
MEETAAQHLKLRWLRFFVVECERSTPVITARQVVAPQEVRKAAAAQAAFLRPGLCRQPSWATAVAMAKTEAKRRAMVDAVAACKAAAPAEVRKVLDDFKSISGTGEHKRVSPIVAMWLVDAHAAAHADPAKKRLARLVLCVRVFAVNMAWAGGWDEYKAGLQRKLQELGAPLSAVFAAENLRGKLGALTLPPHALVAADQERCAAAGRTHELRSDIAGIVPLPSAWALAGDAHPAARQHHERVFTHMLKMMALALNEQFHEMMRSVLRPHVVAGLGVLAQSKENGEWRLTPVKGYARMECKRITDHSGAPGCRPGLNIDVARAIGVCETPEQLKAALAALGALFDGCGRVKNGFSTEDKKAAVGFNLRVLMANYVVDFDCTFAELAAQLDVAAMWAKHVERSAPEGGAPRDRWRAEAAEALAVLTGAEFAGQPVRFICEAQLMLRQTYDIRAHMHEVRSPPAARFF